MIQINNTNYNLLVRGASFYSTGGGIEYNYQLKQFKKIFNKASNINIYNYNEFNKNDFVCNIYGVGSASNTDIDLTDQFKKGFDILKKRLGINIGGIFEAETNIESVLFSSAIDLGVKILDADCTGGRAVPELIYDNFVINNKSFVPIIAVDKNLDFYIIETQNNINEIETYLRNMSIKTNGSVAIIDHIIQIKDTKNILTFDVVKRDLITGELLLQENNINVIEHNLGVKKFFEGYVKEVCLEDNLGFLQGFYIIKDSLNSELKVVVKNENMYCLSNNQLLVKFPNFIISYDIENKIGVHNSTIKKGMKLIMFKKNANLMRKNYNYNI